AVLTLDRGPRLLPDTVVDSVQIVAEPPVQRGQPLLFALRVRIGVSGLVQPDLAFHAVLGERFVPFRDLADGDVPVVQTVYREHGRVDLVHVVQIVPLVPELAVVTREPVLCRFQPLDDRTADLPVGAGVDVLGQYVGVLTLIPTGCHHRTVLAVVVVPARDRGDRDDGLQPLDTGGGDGVGQRAVVGH